MDKHSVASKDVNCRISNTDSVEIVRVNLRVPPVPPTDFSSSKVVKVTYFLCVCMNKRHGHIIRLHSFNSIQNKFIRMQIETSTGCCNGSPKNKIPITIGTYPLDDGESNPSGSAQPTAPLIESTSSDSADKGSTVIIKHNKYIG